MSLRKDMSKAKTKKAKQHGKNFKNSKENGDKKPDYSEADTSEEDDQNDTSNDQFLRPVQWLLWSRRTDTAVVVVPEEAELLLRRLRTATTNTSHVHLLAYAAAVTRSMVSLGSGTYITVPALPANYALPSWFTMEVGILGGRLYMTFPETEAMRTYLESESQDNEDNDNDKGKYNGPSSFCANPSAFLLEWLPLHRVGQDIEHTPAAYVCQGRPLREDHPFFIQ